MRRVWLAVGLVVACSSNAADEATTTTAPPTTTTATVTTTTSVVETTTTVEGPTEIGVHAPGSGGRLPLTAGETYRWSLGLVPVEIHFYEPGWEVFVAQDEAFLLEKSADLGGATVEVSAGLAVRGRTEARGVIAEIEQSPRTLESTPPTPTTFGGVDAVVFDVLSFNEHLPVLPCEGHLIQILHSERIQGPLGYGLAGCAWTRVWIIEEHGAVLVFTIGDNRYHLYDSGGTGTPAEDLDYPTIESISPLVAEFESAITILR